MMKSIIRDMSLLLGFCMFFCTSMATVNCATDEKEVLITSMIQKLEFFSEKGKLQAKLSVTKEYKSVSTSTVNVFCNVFFDSNSEVKKIRRNKRKKVEPIISDYTSEGIFHSDLKICHFEHSIENKGDEVKFSYEKIFTDTKFLDPLYFLDMYDVSYSEIVIVKPEWLDLNLVRWNFEGFDLSIGEEAKGDKIFYRYSQKDLVSNLLEDNTPRNSKIYPHIIPIVKSYTKNDKTVNMMKDVSDLYSWYSSLVKEIGNENSELKDLVASVISDKNSDSEKVAALFYWVQDNIRYVAFEYGIMGFRPEACQNVLYDKFGDCKGMANLLKEMLIIAGFDARLSWIGTNDLPYDYSIPSLVVDNHMICTVVLDGKDVFLDPTEKHSDLYNYGSRIVGRPILIEEGDSYRVEKVPNGVRPDVENRNQTFIIEEEKLVGSGALTFSGDRKTRILSIASGIYKEEKVDFIKQYIRNGDKNILVSLSEDVGNESRGKDFEVNYSITINNRVVNLAGELYVNPEIDYPFKEATIKKDRISPYKISAEGIDINKTTIQIPEGWTVNYLPEKVTINSDNLKVSMSFEEVGQVINYYREIEIRNDIILPENFESWNSAISSIAAFYSDQIILSKN